MAEAAWGRASPADTGVMAGPKVKHKLGRSVSVPGSGAGGGGADGGLLYLRAVTDPQVAARVAAGLPFGSGRGLGGGCSGP